MGYNSPTLCMRRMFQDPEWMSKAIAGTELHMYSAFSYTSIHMMKFNKLGTERN